jgi:hypothetical protein
MTTFSCRLIGKLAAGESWSSGFHVDGAGTVTDCTTVLQSACTSLWQGNGGSVSGIATAYSTTTQQTAVLVYALDPNTGKATASQEGVAVHTGNSNAAPLPPEVALVASLRSDTPGPSGRGRMYLPGPSVASVGPAGEVIVGAPPAIADSVALMLTVMGQGGFTPILWSTGRLQRIIRRVEIGNVYDVQRRRRNDLIEVRSVAQVP